MRQGIRILSCPHDEADLASFPRGRTPRPMLRPLIQILKKRPMFLINPVLRKPYFNNVFRFARKP